MAKSTYRTETTVTISNLYLTRMSSVVSAGFLSIFRTDATAKLANIIGKIFRRPRTCGTHERTDRRRWYKPRRARQTFANGNLPASVRRHICCLFLNNDLLFLVFFLFTVFAHVFVIIFFPTTTHFFFSAADNNYCCRAYL